MAAGALCNLGFDLRIKDLGSGSDDYAVRLRVATNFRHRVSERHVGAVVGSCVAACYPSVSEHPGSTDSPDSLMANRSQVTFRLAFSLSS